VIQADAVTEAFRDSLFREGEPTTNAVIVEGLSCKYGFHPERLQRHHETVRDFLAELNPKFLVEAEGGEGGWSFLETASLADGSRWTDDILVCEQLITLGMALDMVRCQTPRALWPDLPGGFPYYVISLKSDFAID